MQTYPVFFHDWHGQAYRVNGKWHLVPKHLSDHLALDWKTQHRKISASELAEGGALRSLPSMGIMPIQGRETLTLTLPYFGAWVLSITTSRVPEEKRPLVVEMKRKMLDALERQLARMFGLPGMLEAEDMLRLPLQPQSFSQMEPAEVFAAREKIAADPVQYQAAGLMRIGLPASRVAPLLGRSVYWARGHQRTCRKIGLVPLPPSQQRLLDQPSLFGEG